MSQRLSAHSAPSTYTGGGVGGGKVESKARKPSQGVRCVWHLYVPRLNGRDAVDWRIRSRRLQPTRTGLLLGSRKRCAGPRAWKMGWRSGLVAKFLGISSYSSSRLWKRSDAQSKRFRCLNTSGSATTAMTCT